MSRAGLTARSLVPLLVLACGCAGSSADSVELCSHSASPGVVDASAHPIAFSSTRSGSADLWLMKPDGSDPLQLTSGPGDELMPSWSPDGRLLAFASHRKAGKSPGDICVIGADGSVLKNLTRTDDVSEYAPSWSPDGTRIAYTTEKSKRSRISVMKSDGSEQFLLSEEPGWWPDWSPDGGQLVYTSTRDSKYEQLWLMNIDGTNHRQLTKDPSLGSAEPAWSPDGSSIAFISSRDGSPEASNPVEWNEEVYVMSADGGETRRITNIEGNDHWPPAWSPDSRRLLFSSDGTDVQRDIVDGEIVVVDLATLRATNLTNNDAYDAFPAWRGSVK